MRFLVFAALVLVVAIPTWLVFRTIPTAAPAEMLRSGETLIKARRVVGIVAHPDDAEYWIAGTLHRLHRTGARVVLVVASNGEKGPNRTDAADLAATRKEEQRAASAILGYDEVVFLGAPDRGVEDDSRVLPSLRKVLDKERPDLIITFDAALPELPYLHPDHEGIGRVALRALKNRQHLPMVYLFHSRRPDAAVDISVSLAAKTLAFKSHQTQNVGRGSGPVGRNIARGKAYGLPPIETFRRIN
jgi:LmbE family N-acetylglucosaminyl deacetylase